MVVEWVNSLGNVANSMFSDDVVVLQHLLFSVYINHKNEQDNASK
jgi:hypothetical protein